MPGTPEPTTYSKAMPPRHSEMQSVWEAQDEVEVYQVKKDGRKR